MSKNKKKLMIIDGNALIHRSFHALPPTIALKDGTVVNAVYGFASFLIKSIRELKPEYVVLTLDKKGPTFRHKKFKEYKAKRVKAPDELYAQIPLVRNLVKSFNIPVFEKTGFEADDLIGTIAKTVDKEVEKIIVTGDKDTLQLVNKHTKVYSMSRGLADSILYDEDLVKDKMEIVPDQVVDYKALRGDPSDNIPGVPGIGDKTTIDLLREFGTLDKIYKALDKDEYKFDGIVKPRIVDLLKEHRDSAYLSQELATIKCDVELKFNLEATRFKDLDKDKVIKALANLEFKSLLPRVQLMFTDLFNETKAKKEEAAENKFERNQKQFKYTLVDTDSKFNKFLSELKKQKSFTFDTETTGINPLACGLLGISFSWKKGSAYYVQLKINPTTLELRGASEDMSRQGSLFGGADKKIDDGQERKRLEKLNKVFADKKIKKYAHNGKFDIRVLKAFGAEVKGFNFDTMVASYLLNPGSRQHNLDALTFTELGFEKINKIDLLGSGKDKKTFAEVETEKMSLYSCEDADFTGRLVKKLKPQLKERKTYGLFKELEMPLIKVLSAMEDNGIKLNTIFLSKLGQKMDKKIVNLEKKIHGFAKEIFNISSPKQLQVILFEKLKISTEGIKRTKTGISTAADELDKLKALHPIIKLIQQYRELSKLASTYAHALPKLINKKTKRVHTSFNQTVTATGRLSSSEPNLQNIPVRTELGREIRKAFVAKKGYKLLALDYSQIELRLAAHMSGDKKMIEAFKNGIDIHTMTAAEINQVDPDDVEPGMRREAKAINFGILYGQGPHGLAQTAEISYFQAREFIDQYFAVYSDVKKYIDQSIKDARDKGYAETLFGRRRYLPELDSSVVMVRKAAERMAMNTPIQGTAADIIKKAMIAVYENVPQDKARMLLQVHDELIFEVKSAQAKIVYKKVKEIMENVVKLKIPIVVDVKVGENWGELESIKN